MMLGTKSALLWVPSDTQGPRSAGKGGSHCSFHAGFLLPLPPPAAPALPLPPSFSLGCAGAVPPLKLLKRMDGEGRISACLV